MKTLVVEDVPVSRELLVALLEPYGEVHAVSNGAEAIRDVQAAIAAREPFDLICVDIGLPDMDGLVLVDGFRTIEEGIGVQTAEPARIIVITASDSGQNVLRAFRAQADAYLHKPFTQADLEALLEKIGLVEPT